LGAPIFTGSIVRVPNNPLTYYLGTGEANNSADSFYGTGVYKTTDAGQTWTLVSGVEMQTATVSGLTLGTDQFRLRFKGQQTALMDFNETAANVQTALRALS